RNVYPSFHVPKLGGQNEDYLEIALQGYRRGSRSHDTMHAQAAEFSDQDIADIAAYIASLERAPETGISGASDELIRAGQEKAAVCASCHGQNGIAPAGQWPNLAGQHASYLERALTQYKTGERNDVVMAPRAAPLAEQWIVELAAYFASQPGLFTTEGMERRTRPAHRPQGRLTRRPRSREPLPPRLPSGGRDDRALSRVPDR